MSGGQCPNGISNLENAPEEPRVNHYYCNDQTLNATGTATALSSSSDDLLLNLDNAFGAAVAERAIYPNELVSHHNLTSFVDAVGVGVGEADPIPDDGAGVGCSLDDYKCPICLDTFINTVRVDCSYGHRFCNYCITSWISIGRHLITECPVCRGPIFGKTLDLKTDAEIRSVFQKMSEGEKAARLISIKERLQIELPRVSSCLLDFTPSRYLQNSYAEGMNIATGGQYSLQNGYFTQQQQPQQQQPYHPHYHHNQHYYYYPAATTQRASRDAAGEDTIDTEGRRDLPRDEGQDNSNPFVAENFVHTNGSGDDASRIAQYFQPPGTQETSRLPMWMAPRPTPSEVDSPHQEMAAQPTPSVLAVAASSEQNAGEVADGTEIRYQHFQYQTQESSPWNNSLYITPEDNRRHGVSAWTPSEGETGSYMGVQPHHFHHHQGQGHQSSQTLRHGNETVYQHQSQAVGTTHETNHVGGNNVSNSYHGVVDHQDSQSSSPTGASYFVGAQEESNAQPQPPPQQQHHHHHHHFTPVLIPCPPVMPSPVHYGSTCAYAHCYFTPCAMHQHPQGSRSHFIPGMVHHHCPHSHHHHHPHTYLHEARHSIGGSPRMRPNIPGRSSMPIQLPTPNIQSVPQRPRTYSSLPSSPTAGSPRSPINEGDRERRRRYYQRNTTASNSFGGLSPRTYNSSSPNGAEANRGPHRVASCPILSNGSHFSGGFSLFSRGYIGFQISHLPAHDRRVVAPPGRITHPLVSLQPLTPDGTSTRVTLTFDVHRV